MTGLFLEKESGAENFLGAVAFVDPVFFADKRESRIRGGRLHVFRIVGKEP